MRELGYGVESLPMTAKAPATGNIVKKTLLNVMSGWLPRKKEQDTLKKFVAALSTKDLSAIAGLLKKCGALPPPKADSLQDYLDWHFAEKEKRIGIVDRVSGLLPKMQKDMKHAILMEGRRLTSSEVDAIFRNEKSMLQYFSTLSGSQLEAYLHLLESPEFGIPSDVKRGMKKMFTVFRDERVKFEEDWARQIGPHVDNILATSTIIDQLQTLEKIQQKISS